MISGGEISIPLSEIHDVRGLKRHLNQLRGFPLGFRQRLLLNGGALEDAVKLESPMDLDLVLMQFVDASEEQVIDLLRAAADGSLAEVESTLQLPQDPNLRRRSDGNTALMQASHAGHVEVVSLLLDADADKDFADSDGRTALMWASRAGHVEVVSLLLDAGPDKDSADNDGRTALMWASGTGRVEVVRLLLDAGADMEFADNAGRTALMTASRAGRVEIVRLLLDAGADMEFADNAGCTALMWAQRALRVEVVSLLLQAGDEKDLADRHGRTLQEHL